MNIREIDWVVISNLKDTSSNALNQIENQKINKSLQQNY